MKKFTAVISIFRGLKRNQEFWTIENTYLHSTELVSIMTITLLLPPSQLNIVFIYFIITMFMF